ncbi:MAG: replicative DNA helicase [Phycisphaerae bacterium]|nr:replicative DNA helicase [Phycisphaerae bacterium]
MSSFGGQEGGGGGGKPWRERRPPVSTEKLFDRLPPHSLEAEMSLLGSIMLDPRLLSDVLAIVRKADEFYAESHATIFKSIVEVYDRFNSGDLVQIVESIKDKGQLEAVGGAEYLVKLAESVPSAVNAPHYARIVAEKAKLRKLIDAAGTILYDAYHTGELGPDGAREVLDKAEMAVFEIAQQQQLADPQALKDLLQLEIDRIESQEGKGISGVPTGYLDLDDLLRGMQPGELVIVAARPSMGKCLAFDSEILGSDGSVATIEELFKARDRAIPTLGPDLKFSCRAPSDFIDDGIKPVFEVRTRLGRRVRTTLTHPFLTAHGWMPLSDVAVGDHVAVPARLPIFGTKAMPEHEIKLFAYLIGDGGLTGTCPRFTNSNPRVMGEFEECVRAFGGVGLRDSSTRPGEARSVRVGADQRSVRDARADFASRLSSRLDAGGRTARALAREVGVSPASVTNWRQGKTAPENAIFERICGVLEIEAEEIAPLGLERVRTNTPNPLTLWLSRHGLMGRDSHSKQIPGAVFTLPETQVSLFLNRLFATDGWATVLATGQAQVGYASVNEKLARQVQHLLMRFGIIAKLRQRFVKYNGARRSSYQLDITDQGSIRTFAERIGIFGKEEAVRAAAGATRDRAARSYADNLPLEFWSRIEEAKGELSWAEVARRAGGVTLKPFARTIPRTLVAKIAAAIGSEELRTLAEADVLWDRVESIRCIGEQQVYDLTMDGTHNFVSDDVCVHNTALALNIAEQMATGVSLAGQPASANPVALFSLEMSKSAVTQRLISAKSGIPSQNLRGGHKLTDREYRKLLSACDELAKAPMFVDDTPNMTVLALRARARRLVAQHGVKAIMIDYLQLLTSPGAARESRQVEVSAISRNIKALARELNVPVICLSQLNRASEQREGNKPRMSDLRESGSIEQDADVVILLHREDYYHTQNPEWSLDNPDKVGVAELIIAKQRNGPTGVVKLAWDSSTTRFKNYAGANIQPPPEFAGGGNGAFADAGNQSGGYESPSSAAQGFVEAAPRSAFAPARKTGPIDNHRDGGGPEREAEAPVDEGDDSVGGVPF